jgi:hypothetical protein
MKSKLAAWPRSRSWWQLGQRSSIMEQVGIFLHRTFVDFSG